MKIRIIAAALAAFFMLPLLSLTALAAPDDTPEETVITGETQPAPETEAAPVTGGYDPDAPAEPSVNPFTPSGTGTVINYASDADGKVFYTIMTPDEHVFYLVIDKQRGQENVYFLNAVTVDDLMALAENPKPKQGGTVTTTPPPAATPEPPAETTPAPEQQSGGGNMGMMIFIAVIVVLGGGAGWYFKIYRPKQRGAASGEEYEPPVADDENGLPGDWDDEQDDNPPWDEDESGDGE